MSAVFRCILQLLLILTVVPASIPQTTVYDFPLNFTLRLLLKMHHQNFLLTPTFFDWLPLIKSFEPSGGTNVQKTDVRECL